jgi:hypothetical protein
MQQGWKALPQNCAGRQAQVFMTARIFDAAMAAKAAMASPGQN